MLLDARTLSDSLYAIRRCCPNLISYNILISVTREEKYSFHRILETRTPFWKENLFKGNVQGKWVEVGKMDFR